MISIGLYHRLFQTLYNRNLKAVLQTVRTEYQNRKSQCILGLTFCDANENFLEPLSCWTSRIQVMFCEDKITASTNYERENRWQKRSRPQADDVAQKHKEMGRDP